MVFLVMPFVLQGFFILVDEFFFHRKRFLPLWEILGHPLDTLSVCVVFAIAAFCDYTPLTEIIYAFLAIFSSIFVTKDEFVHAKLCTGLEHWLHAVLFILHPLSFIVAWQLWRKSEGISILYFQFFLMLSFMTYQIVSGGLLWRQRERI